MKHTLVRIASGLAAAASFMLSATPAWADRTGVEWSISIGAPPAIYAQPQAVYGQPAWGYVDQSPAVQYPGHYNGYHDHRLHEQQLREQQWREEQWREQRWRERQWRRHQWRESHGLPHGRHY